MLALISRARFFSCLYDEHLRHSRSSPWYVAIFISARQVLLCSSIEFQSRAPDWISQSTKKDTLFFYWQSLFFMCIVVSIIFIRNIYLTFLKIKSGLTGGAERKLRGKEQIIAPHFAFPLRPILVMRYKPLDPKIGPTNGNKQHIFFYFFFYLYESFLWEINWSFIWLFILRKNKQLHHSITFGRTL